MRIQRFKMAMLVLFAALLALAGCGGGAGGGASSSASNGRVVVAVTDAPGDFTAYDVRIIDIKLTRPNGAVVQTLPVNARIDFSGLTEAIEIVATGSVPQGEYTGVAMRLDFSDSEVWVERDGFPVKAAVVDGEGAPLGVVEMPVTFDGRGRLQITRGRTKDLTLDFNLAATNSVDLVPLVPVVTVSPSLVAEIEPSGPKGMRVRGPLLSTDPAGEFFTMGVRPRSAGDDRGAMQIVVDADTVYEVDGVAAAGAEGFALLSAKGAGTAVVAEGRMAIPAEAARMGGSMGGGNGGMMDGGNGNGNGGDGDGGMMNGRPDMAARGFIAARVRAGSSVVGGELDALSGTVIARIGNELTIAGNMVDREEEAIFGETSTVTIGAETKVKKQDSAEFSASTTDLSVGQRVTVFGDYDAETGAMDATAGAVVMEYTKVAGVVGAVLPPAGAAGGALALELKMINGMGPEGFDFTGTGAATETDADPAAYKVATGPFDLTGIVAGDAVAAVGFVAPFGSAEPDFLAVTLIDLGDVDAELKIGWMPPSATAIAEVTDTGLTLDTTGAAMMRRLEFGGAETALPENAEITVSAGAGEDSGYALSVGMTTTLYADYSEFSDALLAALADGKLVMGVFGKGEWDAENLIFTADRLAVKLQ